MTDYTIITTANEIRVEADRFAFANADGDLYCYLGDDEDEDPVAHVPADRFVAIFETNHGATAALP